MILFPKNNNKECTKETKINFLVFWARQRLIIDPMYLFLQWKIYVNLYEKTI